MHAHMEKKSLGHTNISATVTTMCIAIPTIHVGLDSTLGYNIVKLPTVLEVYCCAIANSYMQNFANMYTYYST